jgi:hypothetical protein
MDIETTVESRAPRKINPNLDLNLEKIIMRCLDKDLGRRYQNATELQNEIRGAFPQFGRGELLPS